MTTLVTGIALTGQLWAGGSTFGEDEEQTGQVYLGYVRDTKGEPVAGARIDVKIKRGFFVTRADDDGHFLVRNVRDDVSPDDVSFECSKDGYKQETYSKHATSDAPTAPVEVTCILAKQ
ncbi:MAG TPA: carboxypeptidase-like regulatory domain-containing protein [Mycobacterium sp.]|nr:carboxypeptidase-like regulatory domain-containing protein [Mycobacterium sp.]